MEHSDAPRFSDEGDSASARADLFLAQALAAQRERGQASQPEPGLQCHWCEEDLDEPKVFCSIECSRMFDRAARQRVIAGLDSDE